MRVVTGRHGQTYLLCRNEQIPEKYPRQPVITCAGYKSCLQPRGRDPNERKLRTSRTLSYLDSLTSFALSHTGRFA